MRYIRMSMNHYLWVAIIFILLGTGCQESKTSSTESTANTLPVAVELPEKDASKEMEIKNTIVWHWENRFEKEEVHQIKQWLSIIDTAVVSTYGKYPFDIHFYIHRAKSGNEPVPWAHTTRGKNQSVHFHVNMNYSLQEFLDDWTAQHEISHLSIPFVGKENAWFSEGYATYMQCQVMEVQGVMSADEVKEKYQSKISGCKKAFQTNLPVPQAADSLKKAWNYPAMYWGGVSFFWKLNQSYESKLGKSLPEVLKEYVNCCRVNNSTPKAICLEWDEITQTTIASKLLESYSQDPARKHFEEF